MISAQKIISTLERIFNRVEEGRSLLYVKGTVAVLIIFTTALSGSFREGSDREIFNHDIEQKRYEVRKVSSIPENSRDQEIEIKSEEDNELSLEDIKERYLRYILTRIENNKFYPEEDRRNERQGSVRIRLTINRDGRVVRLALIREARYPSLTKAAVETIKRSNPFQPFPPRMDDSEISLQLDIMFDLN